jgi:hypothetical protein
MDVNNESSITIEEENPSLYVEMDTTINDVRTKPEFRGISFSEFKKTDVKKQLISSMVQGKYEASCYWCAELVCAGHYDDLWEILIIFYFQYIHICNPMLCIYLNKRLLDFKTIMNSGFKDMELSARNNHKVRKLFCELVCVLCGSNKTHSITPIKLTHLDFELEEMQEKLCSKDTIYIKELFRPKDPRELFVAYNEFTYHLDVGNLRDACYWMEWMMEFEQKVAFEKNVCKCERRGFVNVETKFEHDIIWMIWDAIFTEASCKTNAKLIEKIVRASLTLFTNKYTSSCYKKYRVLMYFLIQLMITPTTPSMNAPLISNKNQLEHYITHIHHIYGQVKQNEYSPHTEYLNTNSNQSNLEQTIANLDAMNSMGASYIPKI